MHHLNQFDAMSLHRREIDIKVETLFSNFRVHNKIERDRNNQMRENDLTFEAVAPKLFVCQAPL